MRVNNLIITFLGGAFVASVSKAQYHLFRKKKKTKKRKGIGCLVKSNGFS